MQLTQRTNKLNNTSKRLSLVVIEILSDQKARSGIQGTVYKMVKRRVSGEETD